MDSAELKIVAVENAMTPSSYYGLTHAFPSFGTRWLTGTWLTQLQVNQDLATTRISLEISAEEL